jgi:hypothetical protein
VITSYPIPCYVGYDLKHNRQITQEPISEQTVELQVFAFEKRNGKTLDNDDGFLGTANLKRETEC